MEGHREISLLQNTLMVTEFVRKTPGFLRKNGHFIGFFHVMTTIYVFQDSENVELRDNDNVIPKQDRVHLPRN